MIKTSRHPYNANKIRVIYLANRHMYNFAFTFQFVKKIDVWLVAPGGTLVIGPCTHLFNNALNKFPEGLFLRFSFIF